jgi:DNA-binding HxlR family transcriptional regulator
MGRTLLDAVHPLITWTEGHLADIDAARAAYDARADSPN